MHYTVIDSKNVAMFKAMVKGDTYANIGKEHSFHPSTTRERTRASLRKLVNWLIHTRTPYPGDSEGYCPVLSEIRAEQDFWLAKIDEYNQMASASTNYSVFQKNQTVEIIASLLLRMLDIDFNKHTCHITERSIVYKGIAAILLTKMKRQKDRVGVKVYMNYGVVIEQAEVALVNYLEGGMELDQLLDKWINIYVRMSKCPHDTVDRLVKVRDHWINILTLSLGENRLWPVDTLFIKLRDELANAIFPTEYALKHFEDNR